MELIIRIWYKAGHSGRVGAPPASGLKGRTPEPNTLLQPDRPRIPTAADTPNRLGSALKDYIDDPLLFMVDVATNHINIPSCPKLISTRHEHSNTAPV